MPLDLFCSTNKHAAALRVLNLDLNCCYLLAASCKLFTPHVNVVSTSPESDKSDFIAQYCNSRIQGCVTAQ